MKTKSKELQPIWDELQDIFLKEKQFYRQKERLEMLGYRVVHIKGNHPKLYIALDKIYVITLSLTPSDIYAGRQTLRQIRKVYERKQ